jgi:toxin ParE1/3/4
VTFLIHPQARAEAVAAAGFYEAEQAGLGEKFTDVVNASFRQIEQLPRRFAKLETVQPDAEIRRVLLPKFPYLVVYEVLPDKVNVLAVAHSSRRPDYWIDRRSIPEE